VVKELPKTPLKDYNVNSVSEAPRQLEDIHIQIMPDMLPQINDIESNKKYVKKTVKAAS
jgi:hypothetical protein